LLFINLFYLQHFFSYRLQLLDVSQAQWSFLWRRTCKVKTAKKRCNSSLTTALNTLWYVHSTIFFCKLLFTWIKFDDFSFFISRRHITADWGRDTGTILRPTWISIRICGWRQDHLVDPIEIRCTNSPTPRPTCRWPVMSQPLGACNRYRPPSLKSSRPCNNIQPISLKNMNNSIRIMMNSVEWPWIWDHRWVVRVRPLFGLMVPGTINLL